MKKTVSIIGITALVFFVAYSAFAWGPGRGGRGHMMGARGGYGSSNLTEDQQTRFDDLGQKFYDETAQIREQMWDKMAELDKVLDTDTPDMDQARSLQGEIDGHRSQMSEKRLEYTVEARKIAPESGSGYAGRGGRGRGYGPGMTGGGYGYGRGPCWQ
jgi:zinc resistance-associated protein